MHCTAEEAYGGAANIAGKTNVVVASILTDRMKATGVD